MPKHCEVKCSIMKYSTVQKRIYKLHVLQIFPLNFVIKMHASLWGPSQVLDLKVQNKSKFQYDLY